VGTVEMTVFSFITLGRIISLIPTFWRNGLLPTSG